MLSGQRPVGRFPLKRVGPCRFMEISMVAYGAIDFIPHFRKFPFRDAAFVVDEVVIELDAEPWPVQIALEDDVSFRHHEWLLNVAFPHGTALHVGRASLDRLQ